MKSKNVKLFLSAIAATICLFVLLSNSYAAHDPEVFVAQGIQKLNEEKYAEALDLLKKALELTPDDPEAAYYAAIALSRLGDLAQAEELLLTISDDETYASNVYFELGRIYYSRGDCSKAEEHLSKYLTYSSDDDAKSYAGDLIDDCNNQGDDEKRYKLNLTTGLQYDDNVVLEATNPLITADDKDDGRVIALLTAGARLYENKVVRLKLDYNAYQSLHFKLSGYNVHYQKISPVLELKVSDVIRPSVGYSFEYLYFGGEDYGKIDKGFVTVKIGKNRDFSTDALFEYRVIKYWDTEDFASNADRKGHQVTLGVKQHFVYNQFSGHAQYYYDDKKADKSHWSFLGNRVGATVNYRISNSLKVKAAANYAHRIYRMEFPSLGESRRDKMYKYVVDVQYALSEKFIVSLRDAYTVNDSNLEDYDYDRNVVGLLLTYVML